MNTDSMTAPQNERYERGMALLERIGTTQGVIDGLNDLAPDLGRFTVEFAVGDVLARPGVDLKTRMLCTIAALTALGTAAPELKAQIAGALNIGCTKTEIVEIVMQMAVWAGFPAAINGITMSREAFASYDVGHHAHHAGEAEKTKTAASSKAAVWHILLFQWKANATSAQIEEALEGIRQFPASIPGVVSAAAGENFSDLARGFTHGAVVQLYDRAALEALIPHPAHLAVRELVRAILKHNLVFDFSAVGNSADSAKEGL